MLHDKAGGDYGEDYRKSNHERFSRVEQIEAFLKHLEDFVQAIREAYGFTNFI